MYYCLYLLFNYSLLTGNIPLQFCLSLFDWGFLKYSFRFPQMIFWSTSEEIIGSIYHTLNLTL